MTHTLDFQIPHFQLAYVNSAALNLQSVELFDSEIEQLEALSNTKRKVEFLGVRWLRNSFSINEKIEYKNSGKPFLESHKWEISITHCDNYVAFAIAHQPIGIDIELASRDAKRIINKFTSEYEKNLYSSIESNWAIELWCAKEAVYKLFDIAGLHFREEIQIHERQTDLNFVYLNGYVCQHQHRQPFAVKIKLENDLIIAVAHFK
jgi:phosphopantetheinyl transferase